MKSTTIILTDKRSGHELRLLLLDEDLEVSLLVEELDLEPAPRRILVQLPLGSFVPLYGLADLGACVGRSFVNLDEETRMKALVDLEIVESFSDLMQGPS